MMTACSECNRNEWTHEVSEDRSAVTSTCIYCSHAVRFLTKKGKRKAGLPRYAKTWKSVICADAPVAPGAA